MPTDRLPQQVRRVRPVKTNAVAWLLGSILITVLWALNQHHARGSFRHFGSHSGNPGDWEPWIFAAGGIWALGVVLLAVWVHVAPRHRLGLHG